MADLAARAQMSSRTFARRFTDSTGATPHRWIVAQRVLLSQRLLEQDGYGVEEIARRTGFGTADLLRHHFTAQLGIAPQAYRRKFQHADPA